ncbi:MAG TPA: hypothetical protein VND90_14640 [Terracidiphilus sp.]|nr:hypothetical protein [Terracidiphilus sp.]
MAEVVRKVRKDPRVVERYLERDVFPVIGGRPIASVTGPEVQKLIFERRDQGRPAAAAAIRHLLKRMFDYAQVCAVVQGNPADATPLKFVAQHRPRTRYLTEDELRTFKQRLRDPKLGLQTALVLELILLTLCRKSELLLARWEQVDLARGVWAAPPEASKTGGAHIVYAK